MSLSIEDIKVGMRFKRTGRGNISSDVTWNKLEGNIITITNIDKRLGKIHFDKDQSGFGDYYPIHYFNKVFTRSIEKNIIGGEILTNNKTQGEKQC